MSDPRYNFESTIGVKIIVQKDNKIFLVKEPDTNEWMPGRMSLPGGKLFLGESIPEGLTRKISTEIGLDIELEGLIKVVNILMPSKNVYHFVFLAKYISGVINLSNIEAKNAAWYGFDDISKFNSDNYAEYYNDELLKKVLEKKYSLIPLNSIQVQNNNNKQIMNWMKLGMPDKCF